MRLIYRLWPLTAFIVLLLLTGPAQSADDPPRREAQQAVLRFVEAAPEHYLEWPRHFRKFIDSQPQRKVDLLIAALQFEETAREACELLAEMGEDAEAAVPALVKHLRNPYPSSAGTYIALGRIGRRPDIAVPALTEGVRHGDDSTSLALGLFGPGAVEAEQVLVKTVATKPWHPARWALWRIAPERHPDPMPEYLAMLQADPNSRIRTAKSLRWIKPELKWLPKMIPSLADQDEDVREPMIAAIAQFGPQAISEIAKHFGHENPHIRLGAIRAVGMMGDQAEAAVPALSAQLDNDSASIRSAAAGALEEIICDRGHDRAVDALIRVAREDKSEDVRTNAFITLSPRRADLETVLPALLGGISDPSEAIQYRACESLAAYEDLAAPAIPALIRRLKHPKQPIDARYGPISVLAAVGQPAEQPLLELLTDEKPHVRYSAAYALAEIQSEPSDEAIRILAQQLDDETNGYFAQHLLGDLGPKSAAAVPVLVQLLQTNYSDLNQGFSTPASNSLSVLSTIGSEAKDAIPILRRVLIDKDLDVYSRKVAARALGNIGPDAKEAVPALIKALRDIQIDQDHGLKFSLNGVTAGDKTVWLRGEAALALGKIGDKRAVHDLIKALDDYGSFTRSLNAETIYIMRMFYDVRVEAAHALALIDSKVVQAALPTLERAFDEELRRNEDTLMATARAYLAFAVARHLPKRRDQALQVIVTMLESRELQFRALAADVLGQIGPPARAAIPQLQRAAFDYQPYVRKRAQAALDLIQ